MTTLTATALILAFGATVGWVFVVTTRSRFTRSLVIAPIPTRFSSKKRASSQAHRFGTAWINSAGAPYRVDLAIDESHVYLTPSPAWWIRLGRPAYAIPRREIVSVELTGSCEVIKLEGVTSIRCEDFYGEVFEGPITSVDAYQLVDAAVLRRMMRRVRPSDGNTYARDFAHVRLIDIGVFVVGSVLACLLGQRLVALGIVVGGLLVAGVLGHLVGRSLSSDIAWERVAGSTRRHLVVALL